MKTSIALRRGWVCPLLILACACSDSDAILPSPKPEAGSSLTRLECTVVVATQQMSCSPSSAGALAARGNKIVGGQDQFVKLSSSGTSYDSGTEIFQSNVTVQNLLQQAMGTPDGSTVTGVDVFFSSGPTVTSGTGIVTVANPDGNRSFMGGAQDYFHYNEILQPYQISQAKTWMFNVPTTVVTFSFRVLVSTDVVDENAPLLDKVWKGTVSTDWFDGANWTDGTAPTDSSAVMIPADSLLPSGHHQPELLSADAQVRHIRVGYGSVLTLDGHKLTVWGNVDAPGAIVGGTVQMDSTNTLLRGSVSALSVTGGTALQGSTTASGAVSVTGSLTVKDQALSISIP